MLNDIDYDALDTTNELDLDLESLQWARVERCCHKPRKKPMSYGTRPMPVVGCASHWGATHGRTVSRGVSISRTSQYLKLSPADISFRQSELEDFDDDIEF